MFLSRFRLFLTPLATACLLGSAAFANTPSQASVVEIQPVAQVYSDETIQAAPAPAASSDPAAEALASTDEGDGEESEPGSKKDDPGKDDNLVFHRFALHFFRLGERISFRDPDVLTGIRLPSPERPPDFYRHSSAV